MTIGRKHPPARTAALVVAVFSAAFAAGASAQDGAASDRAALEALYDATGGAEWTDGTHWKTPAPVGEWHGVTADAAGRVTGLDLGYNGLAGPLPPSLGSLDRLRWLDFEGNDLTGPIPVALGGLANLGSLSLARNALTGGVPARLGDLAQLRRLDLSWNDLTGPIPGALAGLANLESLDLRWNGLTGSVPAWLGSLSRLRFLILDVNALAGPIPDELANLADLEELDISSNRLTGTLPRRLARLPRLARLDIIVTAACAPADAAFQEWLATIDFSGDTCNRPPEPVDTIAAQALAESGPALGVSVEAYFSDPDEDPLTYSAVSSHPGTVTVLVSVDTVWLAPGAAGTATVTVTARDPDGLSADQTLSVTVDASAGPQGDREVLEALYDATGGPDWKDDTNWKTEAPLSRWHGVTTDAAGRVTRLELDDNGLVGSIPPALGSLGRLERLDLGENGLAGPIPGELGSLERLGWLYLDDNALAGPIPDELASLTSLERLFLRSNALTGHVPAWLGDLTRFQVLDVGWNDLTGPIPAELGRLARLQLLGLFGNALTGRIPSDLGRLVNLRWLYLHGNELSGPVPAWLGDLTLLRRLYLSDNDLSGRIPGALGGLADLEHLYLHGNGLAGAIPGALGNLSNLERLYLYDNALTGGVPDELGRLSNLERLDLSYNWGLSGPLPPRLRLPSLEVLDLLVTRACAPAAWEGRLEEVDFIGRVCRDETDVTIDVAVVYTRAAREAAGGAAAIEAEIDLLIAETNQAYAASGVGHRVALVERSEVSYDGTGDGLVDIRRLLNPSDDHLDELHDLRDRVGADLVHLIVAEAEDICGIAQRPGAFSLTPHGCGGRSFAHELGHNLGLQHDRYQVHHLEDGVSAHPAYGYVNQRGVAAGARRPTRWRTIMAYHRQCSDAYAGCSSPLRFSNPDQRYNGDPLGIAFGGGSGVTGPSDAVAVLNATGPAVAEWRDHVYRGPNRPPAAAGTLPDRRLGLGDTLDVDASQAFVDPDGDALSYTVSSSAPGVVTARVAGGRVTLTAMGAGAAAIRVTAADPGGLTASQSFVVLVGANRPPAAVGTLPDVRLPDLGATLDVDVSRGFDDPDGDALTYVASSSAPEVATASAAGTRVTLAAAGLGRAEIEVTATDSGGLSATQSFVVRVTAPFTDDPIRPGETPIKAVHFTELRTRIDVLRSEAGLGPFAWTDPVLTAGVTPVRLAHLLELRAALAAAYAAAGRAAPSWTDAAPVAETTPIRAAHLVELRGAVLALE